MQFSFYALRLQGCKDSGYSKYIRKLFSYFHNFIQTNVLIECLQYLKKGGGELATMKTIFYSIKLSNSNCPQNKLIKSESILFSSQQLKILVKAQCCFTPLLFFHVICCENVASLNKLDKGLEMSCLVKIRI